MQSARAGSLDGRSPVGAGRGHVESRHDRGASHDDSGLDLRAVLRRGRGTQQDGDVLAALEAQGAPMPVNADAPSPPNR